MSFPGFSAVSAHEARAKLQALDASQAMIEFALDGTILGANTNFLTALGYTLEEIQGHHHSMLVEAAYRDSAEYAQFWEALRRGEHHAAEFKRIGKGGREVWLQASYNPILDRHRKPYRIMKLASDITAAKLRSADYEGQVNAINKSQAVISFNMDGTVISANQNFLEVLGYRPEEIKGRHHSMFVEPGYRDSEEYKQFWTNLRRGEFQAAEYKRIGKGGKEVWIQATYNPIFDPSGRPFKVVKFATDITRQVQDRMQRVSVGREVDSRPGRHCPGHLHRDRTGRRGRQRFDANRIERAGRRCRGRGAGVLGGRNQPADRRRVTRFRQSGGGGLAQRRHRGRPGGGGETYR